MLKEYDPCVSQLFCITKPATYLYPLEIPSAIQNEPAFADFRLQANMQPS